MKRRYMISDAEQFVNLRNSKSPSEYLKAANETAPVNVWLDVISRFPDMKIWVAHNKTVQIEVLEQLARDPDPNVRTAVAMKNKLTPSLIQLLSTDPAAAVRERIAYHKKTPIQILRLLVADPVVSVSHVARERLRSTEAKEL